MGEKTEATEADLQEAYDRARSVGLFLVEKYAREVLKDHKELKEFVMGMGTYNFWVADDLQADFGYLGCNGCVDKLDQLMEDWDDVLKLTGEPMRFTADGPVRREW